MAGGSGKYCNDFVLPRFFFGILFVAHVVVAPPIRVQFESLLLPGGRTITFSCVCAAYRRVGVNESMVRGKRYVCMFTTTAARLLFSITLHFSAGGRVCSPNVQPGCTLDVPSRGMVKGSK